MPQGKGTYGSQVGRPSKKKYNKGGSVDPFSTRNPEGVPAEQLSEAMENQNMANEGLPTSNAQERSQASPDVTEYKEGGKVRKSPKEGWKSAGNVTDIVKEVEGNIRTDKSLAPTKPWKELKEARKKRIAKLVTRSLSKNKKGKK